MKEALEICILAAGVGSRMGSRQAKALQTLAGKPLLEHLLDTVAGLAPAALHVVVGDGGEAIKARFHDRGINWVQQAEPLGTGHAVLQAAPQVGEGSRLLVCLADTPLVRLETFRALLALPVDLAILSVKTPSPSGYGRLVRQGREVCRIVEEKDATDEEKRICEVNSGIMAAKAARLAPWLRRLTRDNAQREYLLTDIVAEAHREGAAIGAHMAQDPLEAAGVNSYRELSDLERGMQQRQAQRLMDSGVQLMDPARFDLRGALKAGRGVQIDVNVIIEGEVTLGDDVCLGPNVILRDSSIGAGSEIKANSLLDGAEVGAGCTVGPFARLRPGAVLADGAAIGNFVEVKKARIGKGSKASHLAYLGDATLGEGVNIGAGTITCNYDGRDKHETQIGDGAFIGSNTALVAPVAVGAGATVGAGSTITQDVPSQALAVARGRQKAIAGWQGRKSGQKHSPKDSPKSRKTAGK